MICELLETNLHFHFNVQQLHQIINEKSKSKVDRTTIYRTLEALEELGLLQHSHIPHKSAIYFLNDNDQNVHVICETCDKIVDISNDSINSINSILQNDTKFNLINNNFVYIGKCSECN